MSDPTPDVDLGVFERAPAVPPPRRRLWPLVLPLVVLVAFLAILGWSLSDVLRGRVDVTVVRPIASDGAVAAGGLRFQAAGWVEPDPFALDVVSLTPGVVAEVLALESDVVAAGDVVARLVADDAVLALDEATAAHAAALAERSRAEVELAFATRDFDEAIDLTERVDRAVADAEARRAEADLFAAAAKKADAEVRIATEELALQRHLAENDAAGPRQVELAEARLEAASAARDGALAQAARAEAERIGAAAGERGARRHEELRLEEHRQVDVARRNLERADALVRQADAALAQATLRRDRIEVRSPWDGVVLEQVAIPGRHVGAGDGPIVRLYDPARLRVRVDVPFEEIGQTFVGQRAEVTTDARRGDPYPGAVIRRVQRADIQKVTLEVQVALDEPDAAIRPDMLCQVRFLGGEDAGNEAAGASPGPVRVPARLVADGHVWVIGADGESAERRAVVVGPTSGEWIEVLRGLNLTDKLIDRGRERVAAGARVRVEGAD